MPSEQHGVYGFGHCVAAPFERVRSTHTDVRHWLLSSSMCVCGWIYRTEYVSSSSSGGSRQPRRSWHKRMEQTRTYSSADDSL